MFRLTKLEHTLILKPHLLSLPLSDAIKGELEGLFVDKVLVFQIIVFFLFNLYGMCNLIVKHNETGYCKFRAMHICV